MVLCSGLYLRNPSQEKTNLWLVQSVKSVPEYHAVCPLAPITLERSEPRVSESCSSPTNGERVTISSNYLSGPHKLLPNTTPKPSTRSKTVIVSASEVPQLSPVRRRSVELIQRIPKTENWLKNWWYWCIAQGTIYNFLKLMKFLCFSSMTWIYCDWLFLCC